MQKTMIIGFLGSNPELRYTPEGDAVANFSVAVNYKAQGEDKTTWYRVSVWGKLADNCNQYLAKGRQVYCEGVLVSDDNGGPRTWTANDGTVRASYELRAFNVQFLQGGAQDDGQSAAAGDSTGGGRPPEPGPILIDEDEIPF